MSVRRVTGLAVVCVWWAVAASSVCAADQLGVYADEAPAAAQVETISSQSEPTPAVELGQAGGEELGGSVVATSTTPSGRLYLVPTAGELARYYGAKSTLTGRPLALDTNAARLTLASGLAGSAAEDEFQYELLVSQQVGLAMFSGAGVGLLNFAVRDLAKRGPDCDPVCYTIDPLLGALNGGVLVSAPLLVEALVLAPNGARFNETAIGATGIAAGALGGFLISTGYWNDKTGSNAFPKFGFPSRDNEIANSLAMSGAVVASTLTVTGLIYIIRSN